MPCQKWPKTDLLFTDYDDPGQAKLHLNAVSHDKYASLLHLNHQPHYDKVLEMLAGDKYCIYWNVNKQPEKLAQRIERSYSDHIKRYVQKNTDWRISGDQTLRTDFDVTFGELFLILKFNSRKLRVKFEDIERI